MTKAEILSEIKVAEEEAKASVARAIEAKNKKISDAQAQSRDIIRNAEVEAQKFADSQVSKAKALIKEDREKIIQKGKTEADAIKAKAKNNVATATQFILTEFERAADA
ncbi:MAG: ATP synthase archaeal subunit H [Euryarchaeota archaeon]|nr:ATP synthase archaeal subunit H [Euryarchaeota archaeon]MBU4222517.1 ATP synthase archaeal subunit H [Euryarchaeota archaeon]MBU4339807.1 ATP synthase archaeal subunit H [Euryarchaeota archaeon]MBU4454385.1 ATP synthase archaeal subunit H [Euryarchaeota archaeon]MCG2736642.1 ATP synthase archaeal subunit H [Candidatus Methanoperedenaceae archaeon]